MKRYKVEFRRNRNEEWDNWIGDYMEAESDLDAIDLAYQWLIGNGMEAEDAETVDISVEEL